MKSYSLEPEATAELIDTARWYDERQEGLGERFLVAVERRLSTLETAHLRPVPEVRDARMKMCEVGKPWPYKIFLIDQVDEFRIIAIGHHRRRPGYWRSRLSP